MFDGYIVVYKFIQDLHFFVVGGDDENGLILAAVLQGFFDAVGLLLRFFLVAITVYFFECSCLAHKLAVFCLLTSGLHLTYSRNNVDKKTALENLDLILSCLDEIVDGGYCFITFLCHQCLLDL